MTKSETEITLRFTIVYDWLANRRDLSWSEKILIAHILRYDKSKYGCFKSNGEIAKALGFSKHHGRVAVIRIINRLEAAGWVIKRKYPGRERSLFINEEKLDGMPLLAGIKGRKKPVSLPVKSCGKPVKSSEGSGSQPLLSGSQPLPGSGSQPLPLNRNRKQSLIRDIEERKEKRETYLFSSIIDERKKMSEEQFDERRQSLIEQTKEML